MAPKALKKRHGKNHINFGKLDSRLSESDGRGLLLAEVDMVFTMFFFERSPGKNHSMGDSPGGTLLFLFFLSGALFCNAMRYRIRHPSPCFLSMLLRRSSQFSPGRFPPSSHANKARPFLPVGSAWCTEGPSCLRERPTGLVARGTRASAAATHKLCVFGRPLTLVFVFYTSSGRRYAHSPG